MMDVVPSGLGLIQQVILQRLPHKRVDKDIHQHFLHNTFRLAELSQAVSIRDALLLGVISRLLEVCTPSGMGTQTPTHGRNAG